MIAEESVEYIHICVTADTATVRGADGDVVQLPRQVLHRSSLLRQAVSDAQDESQVRLSLPKGVVESWVGGLKAVNVEMGDSGKQPEAKSFKRYTRAQELRKYLQVCVSVSWNVHGCIACTKGVQLGAQRNLIRSWQLKSTRVQYKM